MTNAEAIEILKSRRMCATYVDSENVDSVDIEAVDMAISALEKQDGKKPIEVVRCRECGAFRPLKEGGLCWNTGYYVPEDGYCHDGERKGGDNP